MVTSVSPLRFTDAWTRQNARRLLNGEAVPALPEAGGVNAPAATVRADVMLVSGIERDARLSQDAAAASRGPNAHVVATTAGMMNRSRVRSKNGSRRTCMRIVIHLRALTLNPGLQGISGGL